MFFFADLLLSQQKIENYYFIFILFSLDAIADWANE